MIHAGTPRPSNRPLIQLLTLAAGLALALLTMGPASTVLFALATLVVARGLSTYPHPDLGLCNAVTLLRLAMACGLGAAALDPTLAQTHGWTIFAVATLALALDGVDGWLARRLGRVSAFGARFDMEVDAALAAILALIAWQTSPVGPALVLLGGLRYAFVAAATLVPALMAPLPPSFRRKAICVLQISTLIALICPALPAALATPLAWAGAIALLASFAIDTIRLLRMSP